MSQPSAWLSHSIARASSFALVAGLATTSDNVLKDAALARHSLAVLIN
jgi:hypothetical protein